MHIDFGKTAQDYGQFRAGFPLALFTKLKAYGLGQPNQQVLDVGTGTGTLARGFALQQCQVTALDPAWPLLLEGRHLDYQNNITVNRLVGKVEESGLADQQFDIVAAGQCWHWFDREKAGQQAWRLVKPSGYLLIAHFDWLPLPNNVVEATENLILKHNPSWHMGGGTGLYPAWLTDAAVAGFQEIETFSFDTPVAYTHQAWRGRIRASAGVAASLSPPNVAHFDAELKQLLETQFPANPLQVPHRVFALIAQKPE